jgi:hypothetical protein
MGIPLPAATQWEVVAEAAELIKPALDELIRQAAQARCCITTTPAGACCAWSANRRTSAKEDRTQLSPGQRDQLYAAALERTDGIFAPARRPD